MQIATIRAGVTMPISDKIDFMTERNVILDKQVHFIMIKRSIHQWGATIVNIYVFKREYQNI